jgi:hypothetical protein
VHAAMIALAPAPIDDFESLIPPPLPSNAALGI